MIHKPIQIKDLDLSFPQKTCFENFNFQVHYGSRIAIIGRNGSGKSTLLKMIASLCAEEVVGYVPQVIIDHTELSGGQRLNKAVTEALNFDPNVLLLDEPTNHLDSRNRKSLIRMLQNYHGTLIVVSHDKELLRHCTDILWHIDNGKIHIFSGDYDDYMHEIRVKRALIEGELEILSRQKKDMHHKLMREQQRAAKSKAKGEKKVENRKWTKMVGDLKGMKAEKSQGKKLKNIDETKNDLNNKLADLRLPEIIIPKFSIESSNTCRGMIVQISDGSIGYSENKHILSGIALSLKNGERIAVQGDNGSGKSTLIKAIMDDVNIHKKGYWHVIKQHDIGYLDQHYNTLSPSKSVFETILNIVPNWTHNEIRRHLNDFLFRKNEEVMAVISTLSGGEKARLSLAQIAARTPKLLILDEVTNNLDLETKEHVIQVLKECPGTLIVISHDEDFLKNINIDSFYDVSNWKI